MVPLLQRVTLEKPQSNQRALAPPLGTSLRLGVPSLRLESVGRRHGPSLAQDGEPGVLPGYPRIQACVRPAWFYGAPKIKIKSRSRSKADQDQEPRFALWGASGQKQIKSLASHCGVLQIKSRSRASLRNVGCFRSKEDQEPRFALWGASGQKQIKSLASHCGVLQVKSRSRASLRIVGCFRSKADQEPRFALWGASDQKQIKSLASHCGVLQIKSRSRSSASLRIVGRFFVWVVRRW